MFLENVKLTLQNLRSNKLRSILSLLGIIIGVSSVIIITTLGKSATAGIKGEIASEGLETITVYKGWGEDSVDNIFAPSLGVTLTNEVIGIEAAIPISEDYFSISSRHKNGEFSVRAVTEEYAEILSYETDAGQFITHEDNLRRRQTIVLGSQLANTLFPAGHAIGKNVRLFQGDESRTFLVTGIMKPKSSSIGGSFNNQAYIPYETYNKKINKIKTVSMFILKVNSGENAIEAANKVKEILFKLTNDRDAFYVESPQSIMKMFNKVSSTLTLALGSIAAISLLVGGIGIMNIMLVSVTERTREIGIRKALGAKPSNIKGQFLTEAITLTLSGALVGIFFGSVISKIVTSLLKWSFYTDFKSYFIVILFSSIIGIFFGFYPAVSASKMDPIKALSYE